MKASRPRVAYADLERMPEDGRRYELYDGEVCVVPAPIPLHQLVVDRFADVLTCSSFFKAQIAKSRQPEDYSLGTAA